MSIRAAGTDALPTPTGTILCGAKATCAAGQTDGPTGQVCCGLVEEKCESSETLPGYGVCREGVFSSH